MRWFALAGFAGILGTVAASSAAEPSPPSAYTFSLGGRTACVTPTSRNQARADGGIIAVNGATAGLLSVDLTGTVAANAFLGRTGSATEVFHLAQEFDVTCSDPNVTTVDLTLESELVGYVRSRYKAGAAAVKACASVRPASFDAPPLQVTHPAFRVEGTQGRLCNQHLDPIRMNGLPLGRYVLVADFIITSEGGGLCDGHSAADFSPSTALPADWVRSRDPFQGVDKKDFGFKLTLTAEPIANLPAAIANARKTDSTRKDRGHAMVDPATVPSAHAAIGRIGPR